MLDSLLAGLLTGGSLIVAIGAQNAYVLRQGLLRRHVLAVVLVCLVSDVVLIAAGVSGIGAVADRAPWAIEVVRWLGVAFLVGYALMTLRRVFRATGLDTAEVAASETLCSVVLRVVALTWLNPHVYLDTVLLIGSIAATHDADVAGGRWWFAAGAMVASAVWFGGLGFGARALAPVLARPRAWQVLDVSVAVTMLAIAAKLALT